MLRKKYSSKAVYLSLLVLAITSIFSIYLYSSELDKNLDNSICRTLSEITEQQRHNILREFESDLNSLKNIEHVIGTQNFSEIETEFLF